MPANPFFAFDLRLPPVSSAAIDVAPLLPVYRFVSFSLAAEILLPHLGMT
jgi:hypothetical protein